jgi:hypothetical protein
MSFAPRRRSASHHDAEGGRCIWRAELSDGSLLFLDESRKVRHTAVLKRAISPCVWADLLPSQSLAGYVPRVLLLFGGEEYNCSKEFANPRLFSRPSYRGWPSLETPKTPSHTSNAWPCSVSAPLLARVPKSKAVLPKSRVMSTLPMQPARPCPVSNMITDSLCRLGRTALRSWARSTTSQNAHRR